MLDILSRVDFCFLLGLCFVFVVVFIWSSHPNSGLVSAAEILGGGLSQGTAAGEQTGCSTTSSHRHQNLFSWVMASTCRRGQVSSSFFDSFKEPQSQTFLSIRRFVAKFIFEYKSNLVCLEFLGRKFAGFRGVPRYIALNIFLWRNLIDCIVYWRLLKCSVWKQPELVLLVYWLGWSCWSHSCSYWAKTWGRRDCTKRYNCSTMTNSNMLQMPRYDNS